METFLINGDEIVLNENTFLVSETDKNGIIISANSDFCEISGYELDELLGKPHNIIKHQDIPKDILNDLKNSTKNGVIWKGVIKNKTKDSTKFYWTFSIIIPTGDKYQKRFLCLSTKPLEDEIKSTKMIFEILNQCSQIAT